MRYLMITALLLPMSGGALAQFKCIGAGGAVSFQQVPCASGAKSERLAAQAAPEPRPTNLGATAITESVDVRILKTLERDRRIREMTEQIGGIEAAVASRGAQMSYEMETLRSQKVRAGNNLAGATWEQSISTEMAAVAEKYRTMNEADLGRLPALRNELAKLQALK